MINTQYNLVKVAFSFNGIHSNSFKVEPGTFEIQVGSSSADIRLTDKVLISEEYLYKY